MIHGQQHKALFLDRDGIINVEKNYVYKVEDFEFMEGIFDLCHAAESLGFLLIVVTNQAGIGRGYYGETDFHGLTQWMRDRFSERGIKITDVYFCPDHPEHGLGRYKRESEYRKPKPGMILEACNEWGICPQNSILIGDKESDLIAGKKANVGMNILIHAGEPRHIASENADLVLASVKEAARWLEKSGRSVSKASTSVDNSCK